MISKDTRNEIVAISEETIKRIYEKVTKSGEKITLGDMGCFVDMVKDISEVVKNLEHSSIEAAKVEETL